MPTQSKGVAVARARQATEIIRHRGVGPQVISLTPLDRTSPYSLTFQKLKSGSTSHYLPAGSSKVTDELTGYNGNGTATVFTGQSLNGIPAPGSVSLGGASELVRDLLKNGVLYIDGPARKRGSGGSFAAMAGESMVLSIDEGEHQTITFGTESTIGAAVTKLNSQLLHASASAQGAQNVDITSNTSGPGSSVHVVSVDAGITTKLGISAGLDTTYAGLVNYGTGDLTLSYPPGYVPSANTVARVNGSVPGPWNFNPGSTLVVDVDGDGDDTATFDAGPAEITGSGGSFATLSNETMEVQVGSEGEVQLITFTTQSTLALAIQRLNEQLTGAHAEAVDSNNVRLVSDSKGTAAQISTSNVAAGITTKLGIPDDTTELGTGDVEDIDAVTPEEVKALVEADIAGLTVVVNEDDTISLEAETSIAVDASSTLETVLGLATTSTPVSSSPLAITASYTSTPLVEAGQSTTVRVPNLSDDEELVVLATGINGPVRLSFDILEQRL